MQQNGSLLTGREQLGNVLAGLLASGVSMSGEQCMAVIAGDTALTSTRYEFLGDGVMGAPITVVTAEVSRRQGDGTWRVIVDAPFFG